MRGTWVFRGLLMALWLPAAGAAAAGTIYRCVGVAGAVAFQDQPCARAQRQTVLHLNDHAPPPKPASSAVTPAPATVAPLQPAPSATRMPAPKPPSPRPMYACTNAVNGKVYYNHNGAARAYLAPFGMLGAVQAPLSDVYGHGESRLSAPESMHGQATPDMVANYYVWVRDRCRRLSVAETCARLRRERDANVEQLRHAFSDRAPALKKRAAALREQLAGC